MKILNDEHAYKRALIVMCCISAVFLCVIVIIYFAVRVNKKDAESEDSSGEIATGIMEMKDMYGADIEGYFEFPGGSADTSFLGTILSEVYKDDDSDTSFYLWGTWNKEWVDLYLTDNKEEAEKHDATNANELYADKTGIYLKADGLYTYFAGESNSGMLKKWNEYSGKYIRVSDEGETGEQIIEETADAISNSVLAGGTYAYTTSKEPAASLKKITTDNSSPYLRLLSMYPGSVDVALTKLEDDKYAVIYGEGSKVSFSITVTGTNTYASKVTPDVITMDEAAEIRDYKTDEAATEMTEETTEVNLVE